ncbi:heme exporter protein CcmB [Desulfonatronovibrio hydrogenovorans]|uniref:heme exporter protein CcmB n=1 Tax=Desulfonatronovibrio hydrogenovorans TaxID=53245 RepID=UPI00048AAA88|nr:heme exporter protein CcmB [Desulfonatronovibrio hydrogenovorans]
MSRGFLSITGKDLKLIFSDGTGIIQPVLLGLILVFVFSLSTPVGEEVPAQAGASIFWLATSFALVLVFNTLYSLEEANQARVGLLISPLPLQYIWLSKACSGFVLLVLAQMIFLPAIMVFLGQDLADIWSLAGTILLVDWGLVAVGSLLGAVSQGHSSRDSLLSVVIFPLLIPLLLAGIRLGACFMGGGAEENLAGWIGIAFAFGAVFSGAAMILFPFVYSEY